MPMPASWPPPPTTISRPTTSSAAGCCGSTMTVTIPQVEAARPEVFTQSGAWLGQSAAALGGQISDQRSTLDALRVGWQGAAADAASAKAQPTLDRMHRLQSALLRGQTALQDGG